MSLDQNLFTLTVTPSQSDPSVLDLVDPSGKVHYRKHRVNGSVYKMDVYDPLSESLLATATAPSATSKHKTLQLYNPNMAVELKYTGKISFRWSFKWEDHEFEWKREECFILRKPDPPVLVAVTKEPPGKIKTTSVQLLDYNLNRFDIDDRKGLEIVILTALLTFSDSSDSSHTSQDTLPPVTPTATNAPPAFTTLDPPPLPPPKPAPKTGIDRIAEMQAIRGEVNEVTIEEEGSVTDYAQYCSNLLQDDAMLFVTIRSSVATYVPKVLQVVEQTKRIRHKAGLDEGEDLHQYVIYDASPSTPTQKGPRRINLDTNVEQDKKSKGHGRGDYAPPTSLTVHLSKIPMPELQPKAVPSTSSEKQGREDKKKEKEDKKREKAEEKKLKKGERKASSSSPPRQSSTSMQLPVPQHVRSYQPHPYQPSPSPSQLNNPVIYTAPPPRPPPSPYSHPYAQPQPHSSSFGAPPTQSPPGPPPHLNSPPPGAQQRPTMPVAMVVGLFDRLQRWQA